MRSNPARHRKLYLKDAVGWIKWLRSDKRFSRVIVLGHSEGSLIGMVAARTGNADACISVSGLSDRADKTGMLNSFTSRCPNWRTRQIYFLTALAKAIGYRSRAER